MQTAIETIEKGEKRSKYPWSIQTNKASRISVASASDDMFSGFNTSRKAAWLTQKSYRNWNVQVIADSQMLLHGIRE